jgi:hypothetical protein
VQNWPAQASMKYNMFRMTRFLLFPLLTLFLCLGFSFESKASHIIGGEIYEDEEIFKFDPYYNKEIDYNNDDFVYDDEYDLMAVAIENTFSAVIKISV